MQIDRIVLNVIKKFEKRADDGLKKYGVTLERTDLSTLDWIEHAQDELMDGILYLERLKQNFKVMEKTEVEFLVEQLEVEFFLTDKDVENVINQAKEMEKQQGYSEEDMKRAYCNGGNLDYDIMILTKEGNHILNELFEQFKKK